MRGVTPAIDPRKRFWIRATLVAGMLLASVGLWVVSTRGCGGSRDAPPALPADTGRHVRIRGADGTAVPGATAFVKQRAGATPLDVAWFPGVGVLVLPESGTDYPVRVIAPGHRVLDLPAVRGGQIITLKRGLVATVSLRGVPPDGLPEHVRFLLRLRPVEIEAAGLPPQDVVDLMANLAALGSGPEHIPRGEFGYPLSREQAEAGIVLPSPGRYHVYWGLIDTKERTWARIGDRSGRELDVKDAAEPQAFFLAVTIDDLQDALDRLEAGVIDARAMGK